MSFIREHDPEFMALYRFVQDRIDSAKGLPTVTLAASQILRKALDSYANGYVPDYEGGYADAAEDALRAISGVWRHHPDYGGWADDE